MTTYGADYWKNWDPDTGVGDPTAPAFTAENVNGWWLEVQSMRDSAVAAKVAAEAAEAGATAPTDTMVANLANDGITPSATRVALDALYRFVISVRDFGAVGDGVHDDTSALQAAYDYAASLIPDNTAGRQEQGVTVLHPRGKYLISSGLTVSASNVALIGVSRSSSILYAPNATFDLLTFDHATVAMYNNAVADLRFSTPGNTTAGYHLVIGNVIYMTADRIGFNGWHGGLKIDGAGKLMCHELLFSQEVRTAATSTGNAVRVVGGADLHFTDVQIMRDTAYGDVNSWVIEACDGIYMTNVHMHGTFQLNPAAGATLASVMADNCYFDGSPDACISIVGTAATYRNITLTGCNVRAGDLAGIRVEASSTVDGLVIVGGRVQGCATAGIDMRNSNAANTVISAVNFSGNNTSNVTSKGDLHVNGTTAAVSGCIFNGGGTVAGSYAIAVDASATNVSLSDIDVTASTASSKISNSGTGTAFKGIRGWKVRDSGTATISASVTSQAITHAMKVTPTIESIRLTPHSSSPAYWVSAATASTFTVSFASSVPSAFTMGYAIDMES